MTWKTILELVWTALNTPAGIVTLAGVVLWIINKWFKGKDSVILKYGGLIVTAVKAAEKLIPDSTPNKGVARLDVACRYFESVLSEVIKRDLKASEKAELKSEIAKVHVALEEAGLLGEKALSAESP